MWISYPQKLWISDFHQSFRNVLWITPSPDGKQIKGFPQIAKVIHTSRKFIHLVVRNSREKFSIPIYQIVESVDKLSTKTVDK